MQRYFAKDNKLSLYDSDKHHIKNVMRMQEGDLIEVVYDGKVMVAKILDLSNFTLEKLEELEDNAEMDLELTMAIGMVSEQKWDLILQKMTELGVKRIIPLKMERSIVKLDEKKLAKKMERWRMICKEASEQAHRNIIPEILPPMTLKQLVLLESDIKLVASVKENEKLLHKCLQNEKKCDKMIIVVGPEGGISPKEELFLNDQGYCSVSLGKRVLRVETATFYIASVVSIVV